MYLSFHLIEFSIFQISTGIQTLKFYFWKNIKYKKFIKILSKMKVILL